MLLIAGLCAMSAVWLAMTWPWFVRACPGWHTYYRQALSRPGWANGIRVGGPAEFVSWAGIPEGTWRADVLPSVELVAAALALKPTLTEYDLLVRGNATEMAAGSVFYMHMLAGCPMTPQEATHHAMMVYYTDGFGPDPSGSTEAFTRTRRAFFSRVCPGALGRLHHQLQAHVRVDIVGRRLPPQPPPAALATTLPAERSTARVDPE